MCGGEGEGGGREREVNSTVNCCKHPIEEQEMTEMCMCTESGGTAISC